MVTFIDLGLHQDITEDIADQDPIQEIRNLTLEVRDLIQETEIGESHYLLIDIIRDKKEDLGLSTGAGLGIESKGLEDDPLEKNLMKNRLEPNLPSHLVLDLHLHPLY